jgi:hypothetical protein
MAICRPLFILELQSLRFANFLNGLIIFLIWTLGLLTALPNVTMYNLCSLPKPGKFKCEKINSKYFDERFYIVALDSKNIYSIYEKNQRHSFVFLNSFLFFGSDDYHACSLCSNYL